jgi:hypothetical protein
MAYLDWLKGLLMDSAEQYFYGRIPNEHVSPEIAETDFEPEACYLRVWLNDMYLAHRRVLYQVRQPLVHAACKFEYGSETRDLRLVVGPGQSAKLTAGLEHIANLNYPLLGPVPYLGGNVELLITLMAMQTADYGKQLLDLLGTLGQLTGRGEIKTALRFLEPLKTGIEGLFGMRGAEVHLGVHDTFGSGASAPNRLTPGYRVVMDARAGQIDPATLWVRDGRLCRGTVPESATPFDAADYFLFYLEKLDQRENDLPSVREAWTAAIKAAQRATEKDLDFALAVFKAAVVDSPDLILSDQIARVTALNDKVKVVRAATERQGFVSVDTSLDGALNEQRELAGDPRAETRNLSREDLIALNWR